MFDDVQYDVFTGKAIDVIGRPLSRKEVKRRVLAKNKRKGKQFEDDVKLSSEMQGWEVERTPKGKDFVRRKRDLFGRVVRTEHVEAKSGRSKLSKLQTKTKKKKSNYRIIRGNPLSFI